MFKNLSKGTFVGLGLMALGVAPVFASGGLASDDALSTLSIPTDSVSQFSITSIGEFVGAILSFLFLIAGIFVFAYLVWGGVQWITSGGDKAKTQEARDRITAALVGLAIVAVAWALTLLIQAFFGLNITSFTITKPFGGGV